MSRINSKSLIVLDTHAWIWLINGDEQLRLSEALPLIERVAQLSNVKVSAISVWEVSMLEAKGRISFSMECLDWVKQALAAPGISLVPLTPEIAVLSSRLPGEFHGDPADRIIVATALELSASLVTKDKKILRYSESNPLNVIAI
jgi:PIN domain nuclease of toxin-antitoxin system